jgi:NDP-sugar pyrophosphorylase family protein/aminoglycoside/choline kinase family phosphotransferase
MIRPRRAILLAAGFGSRLQPLTFRVPKPLLPLWSRPLILHNLDLLHQWGVREVLINLHHEPGPMVNFIRTLTPPPDLRIQFSFEPEILGTGGALRQAAWFLPEEPIWILNADVAADLDPRLLLYPFAREHAQAALWMHPTLGPRTVELDRIRIRTFRSSSPGTPGTATFCGLQLFDPTLIEFIQPVGFDTLIAAYERAQKAGRTLLGIASDRGFWADLGTPASLLQAHADTRSAWHARQPGQRFYTPTGDFSPRATTFAGIHPTTRIQPGAKLINSVVLEGARIGPQARIVDTLIGPDVYFNQSVQSALLVRASDWPQPRLHSLLNQLGWPLDRTTLVPLGARGSARDFTRAFYGRHRAILIAYDPIRHENTLYANHARQLAQVGVPVPQVLADFPGLQATALEDLGNISLLTRLETASPATALKLYRQVLPDVLQLHVEGPRAVAQARIKLMPPFNRRLYTWEHDYFAEHFLSHRLRLESAAIDGIRRDLQSIATRLLRHPQVLIHRDLQSTNILFHKGRTVFIDFQGMRWGSPYYDLASLLADPYARLEEKIQLDLLKFYQDMSPFHELAEKDFWLAVVQRLAQALGAYAKLGAEPATADFARHIPAALAQMRRALAHLSGLPALRALLEQGSS